MKYGYAKTGTKNERHNSLQITSWTTRTIVIQLALISVHQNNKKEDKHARRTYTLGISQKFRMMPVLEGAQSNKEKNHSGFMESGPWGKNWS